MSECFPEGEGDPRMWWLWLSEKGVVKQAETAVLPQGTIGATINTRRGW